MNIFSKYKIIGIKRCHGTFKIMYINWETRECRSLYLQFTRKEPWILPRYEEHYGNIDIPLAGWLFFYFGVLTEGIIYDGDEKAKIVDKNGKRYYFLEFPSRADADSYHKKIKNGSRFLIYKNDDNIVVEEV